jgi:integrase
MFRPDAVFRITLPKKARKRQNAPSDGDVQKLYESANEKLRICIALAAFGSMRRGEICALKHGDVNGCCISVHADMVANEDNKFEYKDMPKTSDSIRDVLLPQNVIDMLGTGDPDDFIFSFNPNWITKNFIILRNSVGISIRFHDLRHYYASIGAALNIPDIYTARFGGWRPNSPVMKEVYQNNMQDAEMLYSEKMNAHFSSIIKENE